MSSCFRKTCTCGVEILMANKEEGGWVPLDPEPVGPRSKATVLYAFDEEYSGATARRVKHPVEPLRAGVKIYASHYLSCSDAGRWSRGQSGARRDLS